MSCDNNSYEHTFIKHLKKGDVFGGIYYLVDAYEKIAVNGNIYSDLTVRDKSGDAFIRYWGVSKDLDTGSFILILANVDEYRGKVQIVAKSIEKVDNPNNNDMENYYIPVSVTKENDFNKFNKYIEKVSNICSEINDDTCKIILEHIFTDDFKEIFFSAPASDKPYYGVNGGLLSHTIKTTFSVGSLASQYDFSKLDLVIAITSSLIHLIGSIDSYSINTCQSDETLYGKLYGYNFFTINKLNKVIEECCNISGFNKSVSDRIIHAIVSQNSRDIKPMTKEAILLSEMVKIDYKIVSAIDFINQDVNNDQFTAFDTINRQQYYKI